MVDVEPVGTGSLAVRAAPKRVLRFLPVVRSAIVETARRNAPSEYLYLSTRSDFDESLDAGLVGFRRTTLAGVLRRVLSQDYDVVQLPEPLWVRYAPHALAVAAVVRLRDRVRGRRTELVTYAIENALVSQVPVQVRSVAPLWQWAVRTAAKLQTALLDRVAFGTGGARDALVDAVGELRCSTVFEMLPQPCTCADGDRDPASVAFVARLEPRKGLDVLLRAWPLVARSVPAAELVVAGDGPLEAEVVAAAAAGVRVRYEGLLSRDEVHRLYRRAAVVVLASRPDGGWREQIGLPLTEALAHSAYVVTTDQTGIARLLLDAGQAVLPADCTPQELAEEICAVLARARTAPHASYSLPSRSGEAAADEWLIHGAPTRE